MHIQIGQIYNSLASWRQGAHWSRGKLWCTWDPWCRLRALGYEFCPVWYGMVKLCHPKIVRTWACPNMDMPNSQSKCGTWCFQTWDFGAPMVFSNKATCLHMPMKPTGIYWQYLAYYTLDLSCPSPFFIWAWVVSKIGTPLHPMV
jgi:hypothetical protein